MRLLDNDWPECEEFYNLMQAYRHTPITEQRLTVENYEAVKEWLRNQVKEYALTR